MTTRSGDFDNTKQRLLQHKNNDKAKRKRLSE